MAYRQKRKRTRYRAVVGGFYRMIVALSVVIVTLWGVYRFVSRPPAVDTALPGTAAEKGGLTRKEKTWTFLLAAEDQVSGSTDTIMACTYDTQAQRIGLVSIPRDTLVDRPGWKYHKINAAYPNGNISRPPDGGIAELQAAVQEVLGIPIDHYVIVDTNIFVEIVDTVGGVEFDVPVHMSYDAPDQDLHIHFEPGLQKLSGQQALEVVRCRKNSDGPGEYPKNIYDAYPDADIGRTRTQQAMLQAIAKQVLSHPQKIPDYLEAFSKYVKTDLSLSNLLWFAEPLLQFDLADLTTATLPGDGTASYEGTKACYALDIDESLSIINQWLNPYTTPVTKEMVRMVQGES